MGLDRSRIPSVVAGALAYTGFVLAHLTRLPGSCWRATR